MLELKRTPERNACCGVHKAAGFGTLTAEARLRKMIGNAFKMLAARILSPEEWDADCFTAEDDEAVTCLPDGTSRIKGDLILSNCPSLVRLPDDLVVGGSVTILGCHALQRLPPGMAVGGDLVVGHCRTLALIGDTILTLAEACRFSIVRLSSA
jgi:hypothetical protein